MKFNTVIFIVKEIEFGLIFFYPFKDFNVSTENLKIPPLFPLLMLFKPT